MKKDLNPVPLHILIVRINNQRIVKKNAYFLGLDMSSSLMVFSKLGSKIFMHLNTYRMILL